MKKLFEFRKFESYWFCIYLDAMMFPFLGFGIRWHKVYDRGFGIILKREYSRNTLRLFLWWGIDFDIAHLNRKAWRKTL
jgi:hypothetical protein